jgi:hypothetical protein
LGETIMQRHHGKLRRRIDGAVAEVKLLASGSEVHQVKVAVACCAGAALFAAVLTPGIWGRLILSAPLVAVAIALVVTLQHTVLFRRQRLESGRCAHPLCHGVVQHSANVPQGSVVCPTCKRVWPEVEGMEFQFTQRDAASKIGRVQLFM